MDYRVRGFTRSVDGGKYFIDHAINSIQNFIAADTKALYHMIDVNIYQENIFHTKMMLKNFDLDNYLFGRNAADLTPIQQGKIADRLKQEMLEIFYGKNMPNIR
jgi:S-adenosylmethionine decarboxylase